MMKTSQSTMTMMNSKMKLKMTTPRRLRAGLMILMIVSLSCAARASAMLHSLPASSDQSEVRAAVQRSRDLYHLDRIEIGAVRVSGNIAIVDTVMYGRISKPIEGDGKLVVQQYLIKENGSWRVATGDRTTTDRFLKNNPAFARNFPIKRPRAFLKQDGSWLEIPLGAAPRAKR